MVIFFSDHTYEYYEKCVDGFYHPLDFCRDKRDEGLTFICSAGRLTDYGDWQLHGENGLKLEDRKYTIISCTSDSLKILEKDGLIRTYRAFKHYDFIHSY